MKANYLYDAQGRRIAKVFPDGKKVYYYWLNDWQVVEERDESGNILRENTLGISIDRPLTTTIYLTNLGIETAPYGGVNQIDVTYHQNSLGNVLALTDNTGNVVERYNFDLYGNLKVQDAYGNTVDRQPISNFLFTGRELDLESGLYYFRNRYYSPKLAQFISTDPLDFVDGSNCYAYCNARYADMVDPLGLNGRDIHGYYTYFTALASGASVKQARTLGYYAWGPDSTKTMNAISSLYSVPIKQAINEQMTRHALSGKDAEQMREAAKKDLMFIRNTGEASDKEFGSKTHYYGDTHGHAEVEDFTLKYLKRNLDVDYEQGDDIGYIKFNVRSEERDIQYKTGDNLYSPLVGHLFHLEDPDKVSARKELFKKFGSGLYDVTSKYVSDGNPEREAMDKETFMKYTDAIANIKDKQREDFIKYIVGGDVDEKYKNKFDKHLQKYDVKRLNFDKDAGGFKLPEEKWFKDEDELDDKKQSWKKNK